MKIKWVYKIQENRSIRTLAYYFLPPVGDYIWSCSLNDKDINLLVKNEFWKNVLTAWSRLRKIEYVDENVKNEIIWFNSSIRIANKPTFHKKAFDAGIIYIKDLLDNNNRFLSYQDLCNRYGNNALSFLEYYGIMNSIPIEWKEKFEQEILMDVPNIYEQIVETKLSTKIIYLRFSEDETIIEQLCNRWNEKYTLNTCFEELRKCFININHITLSTKHRSFLYRLLHIAIITNKDLFLWKMSNTDKCTFCNVEVETILHLFCSCKAVKLLWNNIKQWIYNTTQEVLDLNDHNTILCNYDDKLLNHVVLITMQYIYRSRCLKEIPSFRFLKSLVIDTYYIEKNIAEKQIDKHRKKWAKLCIE